MAFILKKQATVEWPVVLDMPVDGGDTQQVTCTATFEILEQDEYDEVAKHDLTFCMRVVQGFGEDIQDEDGKPLACTHENKQKLFKSAGYVRVGFINAYHNLSAGIASKNSNGSRATGRTARKSQKRKSKR